uniref:Uncharacterized protein n=1 Tax=Cacopsylla melanoneura TaxID=428564 RepID=A0A8D9BKK9_9HEMI
MYTSIPITQKLGCVVWVRNLAFLEILFIIINHDFLLFGPIYLVLVASVRFNKENLPPWCELGDFLYTYVLMEDATSISSVVLLIRIIYNYIITLDKIYQFIL